MQISLFDTYIDVCRAAEEDKPELLKLLDEHIEIESLIPAEFYNAFYHWTGRPREYKLESFMRFCILGIILGIHQDKTLLVILKMCRELREYCDFDTVPAASQITRFRQYFANCFEKMFNC
jgi:hypothetical protein